MGRCQGSSTSGIGNYGHIADELFIVEELVKRREFVGSAINHQQSKDAAVGMTVAGAPAPRSIVSLQQVHHAGEGAVRRKREPIPHGFPVGI